MVPGAQAGRKILKRRLNAAMNTPYDRPTRRLRSTSQAQSPSWLSYAKFAAAGATKILSPIWNPNAYSEDGVEVDYEDNKNLSDGFVELNQKKCSSSGKSEILRLIEQLLMLDQYSREECDWLVSIIKSRVVDYPMSDRVDAGPSKIWSGTNNDTPDIRSQLIMEAKKRLAEKKVGSSSKPDLDNGIYAFKSVTTPHITTREAGSSADVTKSYVRTRRIRRSRRTHRPKRYFPPAELWTIPEETTEDLLSDDIASFIQEHDIPKHSLANDIAIDPMKLHGMNSLVEPKSAVEIANQLVEGGTPGLSDTRAAPDGFPIGALPSHPTTLVDEQYQATVDGRRSGGKILKRRSTAAMNTPYDRPTQPLPSPSQPQSPSWLSGLVFHAKFVVDGATKIFSPIWDPNAWASSSSSSSDTGSDSDYPMSDGVDAVPNKIWSGTDNDNPDIRSQAIVEGEKQFAEKKVGSGSKELPNTYDDNLVGKADSPTGTKRVVQ